MAAELANPTLTASWRVDSLKLGASGCRPVPLPPNVRPRRLARPRTPPFHGDNTGSNPVGDANRINLLLDLLTLPLVARAAAGTIPAAI